MSHLAKSSCLQGGSLFSTYQIHSCQKHPQPISKILYCSFPFIYFKSDWISRYFKHPIPSLQQVRPRSLATPPLAPTSAWDCLIVLQCQCCLKICRALLSFRIDFAFASSRIHLHDGPNPGAAIFTLSVLKWCGTKPGLTCRCYFLPGISFRLFSKYCLICLI